MREEDGETDIAACVHQINTAILQNTKMKTVQLGPKHTAGSAGEKLKRKSPRQPGNRTSTLKRVTRAYRGLLARSLSVILMSWNISNASLLAFCVGKEKILCTAKCAPEAY